MNEVFLRRVVGLLTLATLALLLSWLLPRPGLRSLEGSGERVAAMDLTKPGSPAEEILPDVPAASRKPDAPKPASASAAGGVEPSAPPGAAPAQGEEAPDSPSAAAGDAPAVAPAKPAEKGPEPVKPAADKPVSPPAPKTAATVAAAPIEKPVVAPLPKPAVAPPPKPAEVTPPGTAAVPQPSPAPVAPPAKPVKPATTSPPASAAGGGTWYVQGGTFSMLANAQSLRDDLVKRGLSCQMTPIEMAKGTMYRVRCGPFPSRADAEIVAARVRDRVQAVVVDGAR